MFGIPVITGKTKSTTRTREGTQRHLPPSLHPLAFCWWLPGSAAVSWKKFCATGTVAHKSSWTSALSLPVTSPAVSGRRVTPLPFPTPNPCSGLPFQPPGPFPPLFTSEWLVVNCCCIIQWSRWIIFLNYWSLNHEWLIMLIILKLRHSSAEIRLTTLVGAKVF